MLPLVLADLEDRDDVRVVQAGGLLRLVAEAPDLLGCRQVPRRDHLQRDDAVEAELPRPVDDAHAPAGDLFEKLVVAEGASPAGGRCRGRRLGGGDGHLGRGGCRVAGGVSEAVVVREEGAQLVGQVGVSGQPVLAARRLTGFAGIQQLGDRLIDALLARRLRHGSTHDVTPGVAVPRGALAARA
jgi:hypothetical protein